MGKGHFGTALVVFEFPGNINTVGKPPLYSWHGTHVEEFHALEDTAQLIVSLWLDRWHTAAVALELTTTTWVSYPEESAVALDEPLFEIDTIDTRDVVRKAFADYQNLDYVVTVDVDASVKVWKNSHHPVYDNDGGQLYIHFTPVPTKVDEIEKWIDAMNEATRSVSDRVKAVMRFHQNMKRRYMQKSPPDKQEKEGAANGGTTD